MRWGHHASQRPDGGDVVAPDGAKQADAATPDAAIPMTPDAATDASVPQPDAMATSGMFGVPVSYATDIDPVALAIGDFNGDGKADVATANNKNQGSNINTIGTVSVLLSNANGTLQAAMHYNAGYGPVGIATGDFNRDGKLDLVTTNLAQAMGGNITILLGNGDGTFGAATPAAACCSPQGIAAGDLDNDGKLDLAIANYMSVQVLLGNGTGGFAVPVAYSLPDGYSVALGDVNNDGKLDVVAGYNINNDPDAVAVLLGNGNGTLQAAIRYNTNKGINRVALGDVDHDGHLDVVTANHSQNDVSVLRGTAMGSLLAPTSYSMGAMTTHAIVSDLNGDGNPDVAATAAESNSVIVRLGNGNGTFGASSGYMTQSAPVVVGTADFNGDGRADLAVGNAASNSVSILFGQP